MSERSIFLSALDITDPNARAAYLDEACGGDARLRDEVETLLASHGQAAGFLETPAAEQVAASNLPTQVLSDSAMDPHHPATADEIGTASLGFLQPSNKPGSLGRLGHYDVLEVLGQGAFGIVLRAFDEKLQRVVAIKVLNPELAATSPPRKRFLREAQSSARVKHENLVAIYGVEEQPLPYLVMEYVPGQTLQQRLDQKGPLDVADILRIGQQIAAGLAAAHAQGLIHRDIKPSNILLEAGVEERAKITDFGLARAVDDASLTQSGLIAGTPMYMAPEQARGETLDHRTDLFSLGSVLYTMASGRPPFRAPNTIAVLKRVCDDTPRPITEVIPETPPWLCDIIAKLHAKDPNDRFQTAKDVADVLGQHLAHLREPNTAPRPVAIALPISQPAGMDESASDPSRSPLKWPARGLLLTAGLHAITLIAFALMLLFGWASRVRMPIGGNSVILILSVGSLLTYLGGKRMQQGRNYGMCLVASLTAILCPGPGWFLGLPVGIWSLIVLRRPEVRAAFRRRAATAPNTLSAPLISRRWVTAAVLATLAVIYVSWSGTSLILMANNQAMIRTIQMQYPTRVAFHRNGKTTRTFFESDLRLAPGKYLMEIETPIGIQVVSSTCSHQTLFGYRTRSQVGNAPQEVDIGRGDILTIATKLAPTDPASAPASDPAQYHQRNIESARRSLQELRERNLPLVFLIEAEIRLTEAEIDQAAFQQDWFRQDELLGTLAGHYRRLLDRARELYVAKEYTQADVRAAEVAVQTVEARQQRLRATHGDALLPRSGLRRVDLAQQANFINPRQDCFLSLGTTPTKSTARITVPGTVLHDLNPTTKWNNLDAPRALVDVTGDFIVQVKVLPFAPSQPLTSLRQGNSYRAAGLVVWNDDQTILRHERASAGEIKEGKPHLQSEWFAEKEQLDLRYVPTIEGPIYLQIERHGHLLWLRWSDDGREWHDSAEVGDLDLSDKLQVGLVAINATSQPLEAVFEDFQLQSVAMSPTSPTGTITLPFPNRTKNWWDWATSAPATWQPLFNGHDLTGWQPNEHWQIEDGCLVTRVPRDATKTPPMLVTSRTDFLDFHVRMEAKINNGGDSGFFFRFGEQGNKALQVQITTAPNGVGGILRDALTVVPGTKQIPPDTWFTLEVTALKQQITVLVDGEPVINWTDPTLDLAAGPFAIESGFPGTEFRIRKIEVKLPVTSPTTSAESAPPLAIAPFDAVAAKAHQEAWAKHLGVPVEETNSLGMKLMLIPPGEFTMGTSTEELAELLKQVKVPHEQGWLESEGPARRTVIESPFYLGAHEVTIGQFQSFIAETKYQTQDERNGTGGTALGPDGMTRKLEHTWRRHAQRYSPDHPVAQVTLNDAQEYCAWLSRKEGRQYVVPSEDRWEFACRAGTTTPWNTGHEEAELTIGAWYGGNSDGVLQPVGKKPPNPFGLHDMHGGIQELCVSAAGWPYGRAGSLRTPAIHCRSAARNRHTGPDDSFFELGFRVAIVGDLKSVAPSPAIAPFDAAAAKAHQDAWAKHLGVPVEYTNPLGMKFRLIPPGEFLMGSTPEEIAAALKEVGEDKHWQECIQSEAPQHKVILTQPIYLGVNEVTQAEYEKVMGSNPSHFAPMGMGKEAVAGMETAEHPVEMVSWNDAAEFCAKLSKQEKLKPFYFRAGETITPLDGTGYRLPSEAEWEFACRAGTTSKYWIGDQDEDLVRAGWFGTNSDGRTHVAGELKANPFGLYDIHGNVWEWVQDGWDASYYGQFQDKPAINPNSPFSANSQRVIRGGCWYNAASRCRSSRRFAHDPARRYDGVGFRVVLAVDAVKKSLSEKPTSASTDQNVSRHGLPAAAPSPAVSPFDAAAAKAHQEAWAKYLGVPVEYTNSIGMKFRLIPPGEFLMGSTADEVQTSIKIIQQVAPQDVDWQRYVQSESTQHKVMLSQPFYLGSHEVTQRDYETVMGSNPARFAKSGKIAEFVDKVAGLDTSNFAVENVSWNDAAEFCAKLSQREQLKPVYFRAGNTVTKLDGDGYRLPTEAQWEFACRAGTTTRFSSGNGGDRDLLPSGWFWSNAGQRMHAVGELKANPFGVFDMHGNAAEWVQDAWEPGYYEQFATEPAIDPTGAPPGGGERINRVIRGGYWLNGALACRSGSRFANDQLGWSEQIGFRVVLPVDAVKQAITPSKSKPTETPTPAPAKRQFASDEWIDVLPLIDPQVDKWNVPQRTGKNAWRMERGELVVGGDTLASKLLLPLDSDWPAFECELEFTRRVGNTGFNVNLPTKRGECPLLFDPSRTGGAYLGSTAKGVQLRGGPQLTTKKRTTMRVEVRRQQDADHVSVALNGAPVGEWNGDRNAISYTYQEGFPHDRRLSLWIHPGGNEFVFHRIRVRMLDGGTAETLRPIVSAAPFTDADIQRITALPVAEQVEEVRKELKKRNPEFDGTLTPTIENDVVVGLRFKTDRVTDIAPVRALPRLQTLEIHGSSSGQGSLMDLSPLKGMSLTRLNIGENKISDLAPLAGMPLEWLAIWQWSGTDLSPLRGMPLKWLNIGGGNQRFNLAPLAGMPLEYLCVNVTQVSDLAPLKDAPLTDLECQYTLVSDVSPLKGRPLQRLRLAGSPVIDLTPLQGMPLNDLTIEGTPVTDLSPLKSLPLKHLQGNFQVERDARILRAMVTLETINGKPAAEFWKQFDPPRAAVAPFTATQAKFHQEAWAKYLDVPVEYTNSIGAKFRLIPPNEFQMGSTQPEIDKLTRDLEQAGANDFDKFVARFSGPHHRVRISRPYYCGIHEVTVGEYRTFVERTKHLSSMEQLGFKRFDWRSSIAEPDSDQRAVIGVSWEDAKAFCAWRSQQEGINYDLPSEAQWESACRAGTTTLWSCGDNPAQLSEHAVFGRESFWPAEVVGTKRPNPFGLYDLHGNADEWCLDWHSADFYGQSPIDDPVMLANPNDKNSGRVARGGTSHSAAWWTRSTTRAWDFPAVPNNPKGFRLVITGDLSAIARQTSPTPAVESPVSALGAENTSKDR